MDSKKNVKLIIPKELSESVVHLKNITSSMTMLKLKTMSEILADQETNTVCLFYKGVEILIENTNLKLDEIFVEQNEINIEVRIKAKAGIKANLLNTCGQCKLHQKEKEFYFCQECRCSICFLCSVNNNHSDHKIFDKQTHYNTKLTNAIDKYNNCSGIFKSNAMELESIKEKALNQIENKFLFINLQLTEIKQKYLEVITKYFESYEFLHSVVYEDIEFIENKIQHVKQNESLENNKMIINLGNIDIISRKAEYLKKDIEDIEYYSTMRKNFKENFNNIIKKFVGEVDKLKNTLLDEENILSKINEINSKVKDLQMLPVYFKKIMDSGTQRQSILTMPIPQTKKLLLYNFDNNTFDMHLVAKNDFKFPDYCRYLNFDHYLIFSGGLEDDIEINACSIYSVYEKRMIPMADLISPRAQHKLFYLPSKLLLCVGGYNRSSTEIYNMEKNLWFNFKAMHNPRTNSNILLINKEFLFVFGGSDGETYLGLLFEKINISSLFIEENLNSYEKHFYGNFNESFIQDKFIINENIKDCFNYSGSAVIHRNEDIIILGGFNSENEGHITDLVKVGKFDKNIGNINFKIDNTKALCCRTCFYNQTFVEVSYETHAQFNAKGNVILFDGTGFSQIKNTINFNN